MVLENNNYLGYRTPVKFNKKSAAPENNSQLVSKSTSSNKKIDNSYAILHHHPVDTSSDP